MCCIRNSIETTIVQTGKKKLKPSDEKSTQSFLRIVLDSIGPKGSILSPPLEMICFESERKNVNQIEPYSAHQREGTACNGDTLRGKYEQQQEFDE